MPTKPLVILALLLCASTTFAVDATKLEEIDTVVHAAIKRGDCPGAVVIVLHDDKTIWRKAYGHRALEPAKEEMTLDTIFDLASLTKPIATGTSIHILIENGQLAPSDLVSKHWPEFAANGKDKVTIQHLLLHTSGLTPDNPLADYKDGKAAAMKAIANLKLDAPPGSRFKYSDVGYIALGYLVEKISGESIDTFAMKHFFAALGMKESGYTPTITLKDKIAPTSKRDGQYLRGSVHDPRAFALGGVAGHAGLFSTADDLTRYCRMLLHDGELDGMHVMSKESVKRFTEPHDVPGGKRSLGWDVETAYSGPRGDLFKTGYGHTGFTGTSLWIDPPSKTAIIILTNAVHPNDKGDVRRLRREIGTLVAAAVAGKK